MFHPEVAYRDCGHCQRFMYDEETGRPKLTSAGQPIIRIKQAKPPCRILTPDGNTRCAKGTPDAGRELSDRNWAAWGHYRECKAVGQFPDDPIVRRNAAIIAGVEREFEGSQQADLWRLVAGLIPRM